MWKTNSYLAMRTHVQDKAALLISSDLNDVLGVSGVGISLLEFIASVAAIYLLILDRTNWKTNIFTSLLIPYIFFSLPSWIFGIFRAEFGKWIALIAVVFRLLFPRHFPDCLELPAALVFLIVTAPGIFANTFRSNSVGVVVCLIISCFLLEEHFRASGGFRDSFAKARGLSNTVAIKLLLIYPIWTLVQYNVKV